MRRIYACWLDLAEPTSRDPLTARAVTKQWIGAQYDGWPADAEEHWEPASDAYVRWRTAEQGGDRAFELDWQRRHTGDRTLWRRTGVQIVTTADDVGAVVLVEWIESQDRKVRGSPRTRPVTPGLVGALVERVKCVDGGWSLSMAPRSITEDQALALDAFVRGGRRLPVVLVSPGDDGRVHADSVELASGLVGLAHVTVLADANAVRAVTAELGAGHGPEPGGVRLLWPDWRSSDPPGRHPRWRAEDVAGQDGPRPEFSDRLRTLVYDAAALRLDEDRRVAKIARAESAQDLTRRRAELTRLQSAVAEEGAAMHELVDEYQEELRRADDEVFRLEAALEREHDLRVRAENAYLVMATRAEVSAPADVMRVDSLADAIRLARRLDHLVVLPEAERSAREWQYDRADAVYADLVRLNAVAADWAAGTLRVDFATEARRWGLDWARDVSEDARQKHRSAYERAYLGSPIVLGPHLRRSGRQLLRIYCYLDAERHKLVIGHVGGHLGDRTT